MAVPDLQEGSVGGGGSGHVQAPTRGDAAHRRGGGLLRITGTELREELPHLGPGPGLLARLVVAAGPVHGTGRVASVERGPDDRVTGPAPRVGGDDVRHAA